MRGIKGAIGIAVFVSMTAAAPQESPAPTFRAGTRLVEVDVIARSRSSPATGLTKENFTLLDNGIPQTISFFSVRSALTSGPPPVSAAVPLPPGAVSNRLDRGGEGQSSTTVLLIDQKNTSQADQGFAIQRIVKFVEMRRKGDRIGIYAFGRAGMQMVQEITGDSELLSRAAGGLKARDNSYRTLDTEGMTAHAAQGATSVRLMDRGMTSKHILLAIARHLARVPGRKSLIWITTSFPLYNLELGIDFRPDMEEVAHALNDANVALYAVDARGLQGALSGLTAISNAEFRGPRSPAQLRLQMGRGEPANPPGLDTMNMLAGLTGGLVFFNKSNAIEDSIRAAVDDGELTYTLGFYPVQEKQDGTWHNLKVQVSRRGVDVRYRENYFASKTSAVVNDRPTLEQLLKDSLDATQLELVAETMPDNQVRVSVDLHDIQLAHVNNNWVGAVDVSFFVEGSRTARTITRSIEIPDDQLSTALKTGITVTDSAGAGELRIVAQDRTTGAAGSVRISMGKR